MKDDAARLCAADGGAVEAPVCERAMNRFFMLDKGERLPLALTLHLLRCKDCRTQVRAMTLAERVAARPLAAAVPAADAEKAFRAPEAPVSAAHSPVSLTNWIVGGVLMVCFMLAFGFFTHGMNSALLSLSYYLLFAGSVTAYCALFVGANMDFFVKKIKTFQLSL